ncbi:MULTISPECIES: hypothetical protein [unclassified Parvimonas]|uniref:hypothetical protein n=1 Tax=unclassified Parvimonas TaxID=1151464 RepID=UPI002B49EFD4|nr:MULTISPECIES: hypothetical protein [unclassified Parvimonas]MEB3025211.1 hypothetical protein [Parvimonas sp. M13]MEB3089416.1 hypothetical protein [Parvimonas sp. M20]
MKISQNKNIIFLLLVLNCIVVLGLNYIVGRDLIYPDYGMSENFVKLKLNGNNSNKKNDFDFLLEYDDIKVIAETNRNGLIGLYNPTMDYYYKSTKFNALGRLRYFSMDDYIEKKKVAINIDEISPDNGIKTKDTSILDIPEVKGMEYINTFDSNSTIYKDGLRVVANLFALSSTSFDTIYIDSDNVKHLEEIKDKIKNLGYDEVEFNRFNNRKPLITNIFNSLSDRYAKFILQGVVATYLLFCYVFVVYLSKYNKYFRVCLECGATFKEVLKNFLKQNLLFNVIAGLISSIFMYIFLNHICKYLSFTELLAIPIFITITSMVLTWAKFSFTLKKTKRMMR